MPLPVWNCQSSSPVRALNALNSPVGSPVKTRSPPVASIDVTIGARARQLQTSRAVRGSNALTCPQLCSSVFWNDDPMNGIPSLNSSGLDLKVAQSSITGTYSSSVFGLNAAWFQTFAPAGPGQ